MMAKVKELALIALAGLVALLLAVAGALNSRLEKAQEKSEALARKNKALNETRKRIEQAHIKNQTEQDKADESIANNKRDYFKRTDV